MRRLLPTALLVLAIVVVIPSSAGAVTYGLGDSAGAFAGCIAGGASCCADTAGTCSRGSITGFYDNPTFRALANPQSVHRISEIRVFVPYDSLAEWNGSTTAPGCVFSQVLDHHWYDGAGRFHPPGESWDDLRASLIEAHADGLAPVVAIAGYSSPAARPAWDPPAPDPTTIAGYWELRCGVQGILGAVSRLPAADEPHIWEAFNEPDGVPVYNGPGQIGPSACQPSLAGAAGAAGVAGLAGVDGAAKAACDYVLVSGEIHAFAGHAADTVVAGALSQPSIPYLAAYAAELNSRLAGAEFPTTWSVHDYGDVTSSYATVGVTALSAFDSALKSVTGGRAGDLWVTEAGTELTDPVPDSDCPVVPGGPGAVAGGAGAVAGGVGAATGGTGAAASGAGTLGACVNGNTARQALAADAFFALPQAGVAVPITH
ncbi:MAG TPA: hypothetical protein VGI07_09795, partial [Solirubrobacteraceae bacterium]